MAEYIGKVYYEVFATIKRKNDIIGFILAEAKRIKKHLGSYTLINPQYAEYTHEACVDLIKSKTKVQGLKLDCNSKLCLGVNHDFGTLDAFPTFDDYDLKKAANNKNIWAATVCKYGDGFVELLVYHPHITVPDTNADTSGKLWLVMPTKSITFEYVTIRTEDDIDNVLQDKTIVNFDYLKLVSRYPFGDKCLYGCKTDNVFSCADSAKPLLNSLYEMDKVNRIKLGAIESPEVLEREGNIHKYMTLHGIPDMYVPEELKDLMNKLQCNSAELNERVLEVM